MRLLVSTVEGVRTEIQEGLAAATRDHATRRLDALHLVDYKLKLLTEHLGTSSRILNDLRIFRRLLLSERDVTPVDAQPSDEIAPPRA